MYCYRNKNPLKNSKRIDTSSWKFKEIRGPENSSDPLLCNNELSEVRLNKYNKRMPNHQQQDKRLEEFDELMRKYRKQILQESLQAQLDPSILQFVKDIFQLELPRTDDHVNAKDETKNSVSDDEWKWLRSSEDTDTMKNPYKSLLKTLQYTEDENKHLHEHTEMSKELENHIENVTKRFCDWATRLSRSQSIEHTDNRKTQPLTSVELRKMFISGDEQLTPDIFIPISIQDLSVIPREMRHVQQHPSKGEKFEKLLKKYEDKKATNKKYRVVWYIKPTLWFQNSQIMDETDTLTETRESSINLHGLDPELKSMHISQAYCQFVKNNNLPLPKFLSTGDQDLAGKE